MKTAKQFIIDKKIELDRIKKELDEKLKNNEKIPKKLLVSMKDISRKGKFYFSKEAQTFMVQHNLREKIFLIERLKLIKTTGQKTHKNIKIGDIEYRIGYYIVGKIRKANGKWRWGQFCPLVPKKDFDKLIKKAQKENTIL